MKALIRCDRCGSAGSVEFEMCQVCYQDYSHLDGLVEEPPRSLLPELVRYDESIFRESMDYEDVEDALAEGDSAA